MNYNILKSLIMY